MATNPRPDPKTEVNDGGWLAAASFLSMPELVQMIGQGGKTGELAVSNGHCSGKLWFREGQIQRAVCEKTGNTGYEGAVCLLCMNGAATRFRPINVDRNPEGGMATMGILLEAARRSDEGRRLCSPDPDSERARAGATAPGAGAAPARGHGRCLMFEFEGRRRMETIGRPVTRIGRDEGCDISLPALSVSRFHAEIRLAGPILELHDLGSRNGTFVNGKRVTSARVNRGDEIVFGDVRAFLVVPEEFEAHRLTEPVLRPGHANP